MDLDLILLMRRKDVDHTVDGLRRVAGVQRAKNEVACFGEGQCGGNRFKVAHFADEYHIWVLAQHSAQRIFKRISIRVQLALVYHRAFVPMQILDRVFHGHNMHRQLIVNRVDHTRDRGGFSAACWAGDKDQSTMLASKLADYRRKTKLFKTGDLIGDRAKGGSHAAALAIDIDSKSANLFDSV